MNLEKPLDIQNTLKVILLLQEALTNTLDLKSMVKVAHWNVKGMQFYQLHLLFDSISDHLNDAYDLLAERIVQLGGAAEGTSKYVSENSNIPEYTLLNADGKSHVTELSKRLSFLTEANRKAIDSSIDLKDQATADIFIELTRQTDKDLWFLEAHLE